MVKKEEKLLHGRRNALVLHSNLLICSIDSIDTDHAVDHSRV